VVAAWNHARLLIVCLNKKDSFALRQSHRLVGLIAAMTEKERIKPYASHGICGGQSATGKHFSEHIGFPLSTDVVYSLITLTLLNLSNINAQRVST